MQRTRETFGVRVPQRVPITWVGVASEVRADKLQHDVSVPDGLNQLSGRAGNGMERHIDCLCFAQVRLVGDFDAWTRGCELSASEIDYDNSIRTFEAVVPLLPVRSQRLQV